MRLLHRLDGKVAIWPMDPLPEQGSAVVEIYTRIYLRNAGMSGKKLRNRAELNRALDRAWQQAGATEHSSPTTTRPMRWSPPPECVRMLTTRWPSHPPGLTRELAQTEGWTFGVI